MNTQDAKPTLADSNRGAVRGWLARLVIFLLPRWEIKEELMGGRLYWMIYRTSIFGSYFFERWNTPETAQIRLNELQSR